MSVIVVFLRPLGLRLRTVANNRTLSTEKKLVKASGATWGAIAVVFKR